MMSTLFGSDRLLLLLLFLDELLEELAVFELGNAGDVTWHGLVAVCSRGCALKLLFLDTMVRLRSMRHLMPIRSGSLI